MCSRRGSLRSRLDYVLYFVGRWVGMEVHLQNIWVMEVGGLGYESY
jgi:hypothetical protein